MKKLLLAVILMASLSFEANAQVTNGLINDYSFNQGTLDDNKGGFHGTNHGATFVDDRFGRNEAAIYLDGTDHVSFGNIAITTPNYSLAFWIKYDAIPTGVYYLLGKRPACSAGNFFDLQISATNIGMEVYSGGNNTANAAAGGPITPNNWHHVVFATDTLNKQTLKYIDGVLVSTKDWGGAVGSIANSTSFDIGNSPCATSSTRRKYKGAIDDIKIYDRPITGSEVKELFQEQYFVSTAHSIIATCDTISTDGLINYYAFDNQSLEDSASTYDGTMAGGAQFGLDRFDTPNAALRLDGSGYANFGDIDITTPNFTIAFWMKPNTISAGESWSILGKRGVCSTGNFFSVVMSSNGIGMSMYSGSNGNGTASAGGTILANTWHHVAFTADVANQQTLKYIDGVLVSTKDWGGAVGSIDSSTPFKIANSSCVGVDGTSRFKGYLDEIRVYNKPLSATEISNIYGNCTSTQQCVAVSQFFEEFEASGVQLPTCWEELTDGPGSTFFKNGALSTLQINGSNTRYAFTPELIVGGGHGYLSFTAQGKGTQNQLTIGMVENTLDTTTFEVIETISLTEDVQNYTIDLSTYTGNGKYIVFRESASIFEGVVIDNVVLTENAPIEGTLCSGESFTTNNRTYSQAGIHVFVLNSTSNTDSLVAVNVKMGGTSGTSQTVQLCYGADYTFPDGAEYEYIRSDISHVSELTSTVTGCDSIVTINIEVYDENKTTEVFYVCYGSSFTFPDNTTAQIYEYTEHISSFQGSNGCDSTITTAVHATEVNEVAPSTIDGNVCTGTGLIVSVNNSQSGTTYSLRTEESDSTVATGTGNGSSLNLTFNDYDGGFYNLYAVRPAEPDVSVHLSKTSTTNNCAREMSIKVEVPLPLNLSSVSIVEDTICSGNVATVIIANTSSSFAYNIIGNDGDISTYYNGTGNGLSIVTTPITANQTIGVYVTNQSRFQLAKTAAIGCSATLTNTVDVWVKTIDTEITMLADRSLQVAESDAIYSWDYCQGEGSLSTDQSFTPTDDTDESYRVYVSKDECATISDCYDYTVINGVNDELVVKVNVSPNPASDIITIETDILITTVNIFNTAGLLEQTSVAHNNQVDVSSLPNGMYFIEIETNDAILRSKFTKE